MPPMTSKQSLRGPLHPPARPSYKLEELASGVAAPASLAKPSLAPVPCPPYKEGEVNSLPAEGDVNLKEGGCSEGLPAEQALARPVCGFPLPSCKYQIPTPLSFSHFPPAVLAGAGQFVGSPVEEALRDALCEAAEEQKNRELEVVVSLLFASIAGFLLGVGVTSYFL